jgi:peptide/nickel transport system permease protein
VIGLRKFRIDRAEIGAFLRLWGSIGFLGILCLIAAFGPYAVQDPLTMSPELRFQGPSLEHWLGTDEYGRDLLSRLVHGARLSLTIGAGSVALAAAIGISAGLIAGYFGGWRESLIMRAVDFILAFPPVLLAIFTVAFVGGSIWNVVAVIGVLFIPRFARIVHSATLVVSEYEFVEAERAIGRNPSGILVVTILPNLVGLILAQISLALGQAILTEAGLSFLGLGPAVSTPSWGRSIQAGSQYIEQSIWPILWPSLLISLTIVAFNVLSDELTSRLDPTSRTLAHGELR